MTSKEFELPPPGKAEVKAAAKSLSEEPKRLVDSALSDIVIGDKANADLGQTIRNLAESVQRSTVQGPIAALFDQELGKAALDYLREDKSRLKPLVLD